MQSKWTLGGIGLFVVALVVAEAPSTAMAWGRCGGGCNNVSSCGAYNGGYAGGYRGCGRVSRRGCGGCGYAYGGGGWRNNSYGYGGNVGSGCCGTAGTTYYGNSAGYAGNGVIYSNNGAVYSNNGAPMYAQPGTTMPQPYATGYRPQGNVDANGNLINNAPAPATAPAVAPAPGPNNTINNNINNDVDAKASGKIDEQPTANGNTYPIAPAGASPAPPLSK